jgi:two-component system sensor histidine kinase/response regulator
LDDIEEMFRFRAEAKNLKFEISYNSKLPEFVMGDEGRLRQILINLLGNAFKFTDSGTISLKIKYEGQKAFFEVQDTGQGIDQAELGKLFQPFTQTQSGLNTKEGTGLGLTISKNLIQLMNGEINVESVLGKGSKFSFYVELIPAEALEEITSKQKVVSLVPGQTDYKLLVVDDVEENRVFLSELLSNVGFKVKQASNGIEAVQIWQQWQPHLIWMDMRMPLMDGNEATVLIREKEREKQDSNNSTKTVIIALTASTLENDKKSIIANGCDDFVAKPFKINVIFEKLAQKLGVEFIFEEDKSDLEISRKASEITALTSSSLLSLPPELLAELTSSITKGDIEASKKVTEQIREYNSDIAQNLETMIKNYQFDEILGLVEKNW